MKIWILSLVFATICASCLAQNNCESASNFFPKTFEMKPPVVEKGEKLEKRRLYFENVIEKKDKDYKAVVKAHRTIQKKAGLHSEDFELSKIEAYTINDERKGYSIRFRMIWKGYQYIFPVAVNNKGKITSNIPFKAIKDVQLIDPCEAFQKGINHPDMEAPEGIKLVHENNQMIWEVWDKGELLVAEKRQENGSNELQKSKHMVMRFDAYTGEQLETVTKSHSRLRQKIEIE